MLKTKSGQGIPPVAFSYYFLVSGFFLLLVPWSTYWELNILFDLVPALGGILSSGFIRGAVSSFGFLLILAGLLPDFQRWLMTGDQPDHESVLHHQQPPES